MEQIKVTLDFQDDEIRCPKCQSLDYLKNGKQKGLQRYQCKNCHKYFTKRKILDKRISAKDVLPESISPQEMKLYDIWDLRVLGKQPTTSGRYSINFSSIKPNWLKQAAKDFIWTEVSNHETSTIASYIMFINKISNFAMSNYLNLKIQDVNKSFVNNLINSIYSSKLHPKTISRHISLFRDFFEFCQKDGIIPNQVGKLVSQDRFPKIPKSQVKDIPNSVIKQIINNLQELPISIALMIKILIETGIRISEVCSLKFNCLKSDSDGDWWLNVYRIKLKKEDILYISNELAIKIKSQQQFIKDNCNKNFNLLFCNTENYSWFDSYSRKERRYQKKGLGYFVPISKIIDQNIVRGYLYQLAHEYDIKDISGEIYPIWRCHQFRHTHLTDLARKGTGIAHIMQRAGHASPQMAMQYIHLTNDDQKKKMKEVWDNSHFNMEGEIVAPINPDLDTAEMQWIKKGMGMQTTDNGYCTLLWTQTCPHQDLPCKSCGSWVTTLDFLDSHKQELEETEKIIENARQKGYQRQIEKNVPRADRLKKIISGMEKHQTMRGLGHNEWEEQK